MARCTALVTGFRPFLDVAENPSALLVESLDRNWAGETGICLETSLLDTVYANMRELLGELLCGEPDVLVLTGYSSLASGLKIETRATSLCSPRYPDANGWCPQPAQDPVAHLVNETVDFPRLVDALRESGIAAYLSQDAGEYVCNHSYWHALNLIEERGLSTRALFLHLPAIEEMMSPPQGAGFMPLETMRRGLATILREVCKIG